MRFLIDAFATLIFRHAMRDAPMCQEPRTPCFSAASVIRRRRAFAMTPRRRDIDAADARQRDAAEW